MGQRLAGDGAAASPGQVSPGRCGVSPAGFGLPGSAGVCAGQRSGAKRGSSVQHGGTARSGVDLARPGRAATGGG